MKTLHSPMKCQGVILYIFRRAMIARTGQKLLNLEDGKNDKTDRLISSDPGAESQAGIRDSSAIAGHITQPSGSGAQEETAASMATTMETPVDPRSGPMTLGANDSQEQESSASKEHSLHEQLREGSSGSESHAGASDSSATAGDNANPFDVPEVSAAPMEVSMDIPEQSQTDTTERNAEQGQYILAGPQYQAHLPGDEQLRTNWPRHNTGENTPTKLPPAEQQKGLLGEKSVHDIETSVDETKKRPQAQQVARGRADALAQLQTPRNEDTHGVSQRITQLPEDLPSLIERLRKGSQDEESDVSDKDTTRKHHEAIPSADKQQNPQTGPEHFKCSVPDPVQAHHEAISRQQEEENLFGAPEELPRKRRWNKETPEKIRTEKKAYANRAIKKRCVGIRFFALERGKWCEKATVPVDPDHPVEAQHTAVSFSQETLFYDSKLRGVAYTNCIDAAIRDRTYVVFMVSRRTRLQVTRNIVRITEELLAKVRREQFHD
ncbi:hypothetical protein CBS147321_7954 [Aspergillus niger]|nr:hypothetical protein CBS147321_7954 [Aspergillus niger]